MEEEATEEAALQISPDWEGVACPRCPATFKYVPFIKAHMYKVHKSGTPVEIVEMVPGNLERCSMTDILQLEKRAQAAKAKTSSTLCPKMVYPSQLEAHLLVHKHKEAKTCDLTSHMAIDHPDPKPPMGRAAKEPPKMAQDRTAEPGHTCGECGRLFKAKTALVAHRKSHRRHPGSECPLCRAKCSTRVGLQAHMAGEHNVTYKDSKFHCPECPNTMKMCGTFLRHMRLHESKLLQCPHCPKVLQCEASLKRHVLMHEGGARTTERCPVCRDLFFNVERHMSRKHGVRSSEASKESSSLRAHVRNYQLCPELPVSPKKASKQPSKKLKCPHCPKVLANQMYLTTHVKRHKGGKFKCAECDICHDYFFRVDMHKDIAHSGWNKDGATGGQSEVQRHVDQGECVDNLAQGIAVGDDAEERPDISAGGSIEVDIRASILRDPLDITDFAATTTEEREGPPFWDIISIEEFRKA